MCLYEWNEAGMLKRVKRPDSHEVTFKYDALGRRIEKRLNKHITRWVWDGNVPLHEIKETHEKDYSEEQGYFTSVTAQPTITWVFEEGTFVPTAKLTEQKKLSIVTNYLGTPEAMYGEEGEKVWSCELNSYGRVRSFEGQYKTECPFRYQGQYEDAETGLYYNRFRYYSPEEGMYLSQDPIGLAGGDKLYAYVHDANCWVDILGLSGFYTPTTYNAPSGKTHTVYQQDIDWDLPSTGKGGITETNLDRAMRGDAPFVIKDGKYSLVNLHHSKQDANGSLFELSAATHQKYYGSKALHPHLPKAHPDNPVNRASFKGDKEAYWRQRAEAEINARKTKKSCN